MEQPHNTCFYHLRATQEAELNGREFTSYTFADKNWYPASPTCQHEREGSYRRGYWHGYSQAMDDFKRVKKRGYQRIDEAWNILAEFFDSALSLWRHSSGTRIEHPPEMPKPTSWPQMRLAIIQRDGQCVACGSKDDLEVDHIRPVRQGGRPIEDNLRTLCSPCHRGRGTEE